MKTMRLVGLIVALLSMLIASAAVAREYSPSTGRYIQYDPIGLSGGWNGLDYAAANPLAYTDPLGLSVKCKTIAKIPLIADLQECTEDGTTPTEQEARDAKRMSERV